MKISYSKKLVISLGLLSAQALCAQHNETTLNQTSMSANQYSNIGGYTEHAEETTLQDDLAPQMMINPDEITAEIEALEKWFKDLGVSDTKKTAAQQDITSAKTTITTGIAEKDNAIQAATTEIEEHNKHSESIFSAIARVQKTTTKEKAAAEVMRLEKVKEAWARQALNWEIASQNNKEANAESSIQFARLARVYEIASEEAYQAERIWNALKDKKEASSTDMKKTCVTLLGESIEFTKKSSFERSEELFKQADNAWKEIKKQTIGGKIAQAADHATSVLQYVNIFGIISPAAFSQIISLSANAMNNQEVATIVANTLEGSARKYYAKIARIEARESTSEVFKNRMKDLENNLKFLKLEKERIDKKNQDEEAIDREIERAEIRLNAHREACDVFWPTETPIKIGEGISSFSLNQPSSSSSSNNNIISSQDVSESTPQPTGRFQVAVGYKGDRADKDVVLMQRAQEKIETAAITRAEFIKFVRDDAQQRDDDAAELDAL